MGAIRDPIHGYIQLDRTEMRGVDTPEIQRLRRITQLGLTERVYPGARHSRFEHALGTLEVASRIFDHLRGRLGIEGILRPLGLTVATREFEHLRSVARWVALLHDIGHAPFSHVTEGLLPGARSHEEVSARLAGAGAVGDALEGAGKTLRKGVLAVLGASQEPLPAPLAFVRDVIAGPVGADRMDYLLRDSAATGVSYGIFDLGRILHTILPVVDGSGVRLGLGEGGVLAAEGMLWSRISMFQQVYHHRTRRILDRHLVDFLGAALPGGAYPDDRDQYLQWDDPRIHEMLRRAAQDPGAPGHDDSRRLRDRRHHRMLPQVLESEHESRLREWLAEWKRAVEATAPGSNPIPDVITPPRVGEEESGVPVLRLDGTTSTLQRVSSLVARLHLRPMGRLYVDPETRDAPSFPPPAPVV